ncbi:penicillin acylase family protein [Mesorhizobium sp. IRAMC:0171]|uniref:Penicillin acylase family protein n=2 Tax=Mesorhizobium retamae TaxID=2912854 RepID=A0ABS9QNA6_9HYPH|nr:penicillin acylase family protein [Mesorhizobium sp. IRAMC:0171]MCG7508939.1 penicillin acylase family protein [Mesorhizobium sp. IRAMC:0171]
MRSLRLAASATLPYALTVLLAGPALADMSTAVRSDAYSVKGLDQPAEILIDHWGIAHIYAKSNRDALFLQGYNAARDRLWQIDLWRKRGLGRLAESFGEDFAERDRAARLFLFRGDMDKEWAAYGPNAKSFAQAFVAGVNAYVSEVLAGSKPLPIEFSLSGSKPEIWGPEDVVRIRSHGLTRNVSSEVKRAQVTCKGDIDADRLRSKLEPEWKPEVPEGLDPCIIPADVLKDYDWATDSVDFSPPKKKAELYDPQPFLDKADGTVDNIGSNNWVVAPARTATGRPILANDPHRAHSAPSLRYIVHLNSPDMSVVGAGEPALPGISIGHNGTIAFGLTIFNVDQEDLYVYELNPDNPNQYKYKDGWEDMKTVEETIQVRDGEPRKVSLKFTRHGPVVKTDDENHRAFAVRSVWMEPGTSAYFGSSDYMTAKNWNEFLTAMNRFYAPSENQVYADTQGNIGWVAAAMTPARKNWDGLLPIPGDGRYEWGFLKRDDLPSVYNPAEGWFATANQMNLPEGYPAKERKVGFEWADPSRYQRIAQVLSANDKVTLADSMKLQNDDVNLLAERAVKLLKAVELPADASAEVKQAAEMLRNWNASNDIDSAPAAIYEMWISQHLPKALIARVVPEAARKAVGKGSGTATIDMLEAADESLGKDPEATRAAILSESLASAVTALKERLGNDMEKWRWGDLHRAIFNHSLSPVVSKAMQEQLTVGPWAMSGSSTTPHAASYNSDFTLMSGASFRMVLDVGGWDNSRVINTPGQSGDPFSPHYRDLAPLWLTGDYVPLFYSREAVEGAAATRISLTPAK